jgi:hypothetical protein
VVFYELLTGELPRGPLVQPSAKSDADPRVDAIVAQAMEHERERRQHSAGEMRTQVETIAGGRRNAEGGTAEAAGDGGARSQSVQPRCLRSRGAVARGFSPAAVYFSRVTMEVKRTIPAPSEASSRISPGRALDPMFVSTQFQVLQKTEILYPVIEISNSSSLVHGSASDADAERLQKLLECWNPRSPNTGLIEIGVYSNDAQEARTSRIPSPSFTSRSDCRICKRTSTRAWNSSRTRWRTTKLST